MPIQSLPRRLLTALIAAGMYASCLFAPAFAEPAMTTVRLAQNLSPISGITIVAKERGIFEKHGLNVVVSNFTSGRLALEATIGGGADIATTAEAPVTAAAMAGQEIAFLTRMEYSDLKTLVTTASGIETIQDLEGKRLGLATGTGSEVYVSALLKAAGLTKGDVRLVSRKPWCPRWRPAEWTPLISGSRISPMPAKRWVIRCGRSIPLEFTPRLSISSPCNPTLKRTVTR